MHAAIWGVGIGVRLHPGVDIEDDERVLCCTVVHVLKLRRHVDMEWEERLLNFLVPHACAAM